MATSFCSVVAETIAHRRVVVSGIFSPLGGGMFVPPPSAIPDQSRWASCARFPLSWGHNAPAGRSVQCL